MIDKDLIEEKINLITRDLARLKEFSNFTFEEVAKDYIKYAALKNFLMEIIGRAVDINSHLISELATPKTEAPKRYKDTFLLLCDFGVFPEGFAEEISKSAGFRNAIVHEYNNLDKGLVYKTVGDAIRQYTKYCEYILKFIEENKSEKEKRSR